MRTAPGGETVGTGWLGVAFRRWRHMDDPTLRNSVLRVSSSVAGIIVQLGEALNET